MKSKKNSVIVNEIFCNFKSKKSKAPNDELVDCIVATPCL